MVLYYAVFNPEGESYNVSFPDLDGAFTFGNDMSDALMMARDLMAGWLIDAEDDGEEFPSVTSPSDITLETGDLIIPIEVNLALYRQKFDQQMIKKTLTIPKYLNELGKEADVNFSATLSEALKEKLGV